MSPVNVLVTVLTRDRDSPSGENTRHRRDRKFIRLFVSILFPTRISLSLPLSPAPPNIAPGNFQKWWGGGRWKESFVTTRKRTIRATGKLAIYIAVCPFSVRNRENIADGPIQSSCSTLRGAHRMFHMHEDTVSAFSRQVIIIQGARRSSLTSLQRLDSRAGEG